MAAGFDYDSYLVYNTEGKIKQLEYIKKTTELGNISIALGNSNCGVLITHTPPRSKLAERQQKVFEINPQTLFTFSGITNDGLNIVRYLKTHSVFEDVIKDRPLHHLASFDSLCINAALRTLTGSERVYGVAGVLMTDYEGIKIVEFEPAGYVREVIGSCIGSSSQSCRTILEEEYEQIAGASEENLINLGLKALKNAFLDPEEHPLLSEDVTIFVITAGSGIKKIENVVIQ